MLKRKRMVEGGEAEPTDQIRDNEAAANYRYWDFQNGVEARQDTNDPRKFWSQVDNNWELHDSGAPGNENRFKRFDDVTQSELPGRAHRDILADIGRISPGMMRALEEMMRGDSAFGNAVQQRNRGGEITSSISADHPFAKGYRKC